MGEDDYEQNVHDITSMIKDGLIIPVQVTGPDGQPRTDYIVSPKGAFYRTQSVNSDRFGLAVEAVEDFATLAQEAKYHMSEQRAAVLEVQMLAYYDNVLKNSISAKSSETMRDKRSAQTSLIDKYLKRSQERIIDLKGEAKRSIWAGIVGQKEAERDQ